VVASGAVSCTIIAVGTGVTFGSGTGWWGDGGGGIELPGRRAGGLALPAGRFGSWMPVGGALRAGPRRGGKGGKRRPHA